MRRFLAIAAALGSVLISADACEAPAAPAPRAVDQQRAQAAREAAIEQTFCYECENIKNRRILFGKPGLIGYVVFLNYSGQPIMYMTVQGKCTSSGKKLEDNFREMSMDRGEYRGTELVPGPGEDGTYGQSDSYIYCRGADGRYIQWNGNYLYSDKPFDLTIKPLVIDTSAKLSGQ